MERLPGRLYHSVPAWVPDGACFHIRIRAEWNSPSLIAPEVADPLLDSVRRYHKLGKWYCRLFLLMPDHSHGLFSFPRHLRMGEVIGGWKSFHAKRLGIPWQEGFFDHRLRNDHALEEKAAYIRNNPVVKELCATADEWPWVIDLQDCEK